MFPIRKVDQLQAEDIEYLGTKRKFWFTSSGQRYLFKAEERGTGEDWAEKVVCELARRLGLSHVEYDLAHEYEGQTPIQPGVICPSFAPRPLSLVLGNQLLVRRDPAYPAEAERKFGFILNAFEYGAPPHGGIAFGFDRLCSMVINNEDYIRDYIAFPKNNAGRDVMLDSPGDIDEKLKKELGLA